jgi:hypothetical protein
MEQGTGEIQSPTLNEHNDSIRTYDPKPGIPLDLH